MANTEGHADSGKDGPATLPMEQDVGAALGADTPVVASGALRQYGVAWALRHGAMATPSGPPALGVGTLVRFNFGMGANKKMRDGEIREVVSGGYHIWRGTKKRGSFCYDVPRHDIVGTRASAGDGMEVG